MFEPWAEISERLQRISNRTHISTGWRCAKRNFDNLCEAMALSAVQVASSTSRQKRLVKICSELPEASHEARGDGHIAFIVRKKIFAYYLFDHHDDGMIAFCCKSSIAEQRRLVHDDPESFFVPAYLGARGWVAIRLDLDEVDWSTVNELAKRAFQSIAPRKLAVLVD